MTEKRAKRKLTAILSADVKGYSRLMGEDELSTVETLKQYRDIIGNLVMDYQGRVIDSPGDNILSEFSSVVDAVECGVKIQEELKAKNAELSEHRRMEFRIGVNLGDVLEDEGLIYGDGVNVASRVEGLAEGGGVCISGTAFDQIGRKLPFGYKFLGEQEVKNIEKPVRVYSVLMDQEHAGKVIGKELPKQKRWRWAAIAIASIIAVGAWAFWHFSFRPPPIEPASIDKMAYPLPDKPSIAVLPFDNLSGDPGQDYIADGISENIISALSYIQEMFVIARNSTFAYKGKPVKIQQVSEELGVRYVLEGSIQTSGDRIRVTAQLIDATTGHHLWSERYDRELKDLFSLQDEITLRILRALQVKLTEGEQARLWSTTDNLEAWSKVIKGSKLFERYTRQSNARAQHLYEQAVKLDPNWDMAWTMLGWTHWFEARFGWSKSPAESIKRAVEIAQKAVTINPDLPEVHSLRSNIYLLQGEYEKAITEGEKAIALGPNSALCHALFAYPMICVGRFEEAIMLAEKAIRLSPYSSRWFLLVLDDAYRMSGRYEEALAVGKQYLERCQKGECNPFPAHMGLAATYVGLGRIDEARAHTAKLLKIDPSFSLDKARRMISFKDPAHLERALDTLRQAGLPEHAPRPLPDKPSIAVLPFVNMSGDPEQEYFSDGITEEIITALSKVPGLFVIARNSTFTYKGKPIKVQKAARELGVRYILEGSVRKSGDRVRITAQLIDATSGNHLWAERYDRDLKDIFAVQDDIAKRIIVALQIKLTEGEQARISGKGTNNLDAYLKTLQAREQFYRMNRQGSMRARELAEEAIDIDPAYATPYVMLALTHMMDFWFKFTESPQESIRLADKATKKALALDSSDPGTYAGLCMLYIMQRRHDKAVEAGKRAVELSPSGASAHSSLATALNYAGRHEEAIVFLKKAISLNPFPPSIYLRNLGALYRMLGRYEEAIGEYRKSLQKSPDDLFTHLGLAICYVSLHREEEAGAEAAEVLRIHPKFSLEHFAKTLPYKNQSDIDYVVASLRKAGLK